VNEVNFASLLMIPTNWDFTQAQSLTLREIKKFHIKGEALQLSRFQDRPADIETKRLETALRVPKRKASGEAHDQIKDPARLFPSPRLAISNQASVESARAEGNVYFVIRDRLDYFGRFLERGGEIGVEEQPNRALRCEQPATHGRAFASIRKVFEQLRRHFGPGQYFAHDLGRFVS